MARMSVSPWDLGEFRDLIHKSVKRLVSRRQLEKQHFYSAG